MVYKFRLDLETKDLEDQVLIVLREINSSTPQRFIKESEKNGYEVSDLRVDLEEQYKYENRIIDGIRTQVPLIDKMDLDKIIGMSAVIGKKGKTHTVKLTKRETEQTYVSTGSRTKAVQYNPIEVEINGESDLTEGEIIQQLENCLQVYEMRIQKQSKEYCIDTR